MKDINTPAGGNDQLKSERESLVVKGSNELSKTLDIPQELKDRREEWKEKINGIGDDIKEKIIKATEQIPVKVEIEGDGSRLIEFKLGGKKYRILDPRFDVDYDDSRFKVHNRAYFSWMEGDNVDGWKNEKLKKYVKEKQGEGLHIAKIEEIKSILQELGKESGLSEESDQIAMHMYLTGMIGNYWLTMGNNKESGSGEDRSIMDCMYDNSFVRSFDYASDGSGNLYMMSVE